ncbi:hypothetical protein [Halomonas cibimaris]
MKKRWEQVQHSMEALKQALSQAGVRATVACRQLYHDREEVTVHVRLLD